MQIEGPEHKSIFSFCAGLDSKAIEDILFEQVNEHGDPEVSHIFHQDFKPIGLLTEEMPFLPKVDSLTYVPYDFTGVEDLMGETSIPPVATHPTLSENGPMT